MGEFPFFGLPAILVPYPHAWRYQKVNAEWLAQRGAAVVTPDETLATTLLPLVSELLRSPERCAALRAAAQELARPDAARRIADLMLSWGQGA